MTPPVRPAGTAYVSTAQPVGGAAAFDGGAAGIGAGGASPVTRLVTTPAAPATTSTAKAAPAIARRCERRRPSAIARCRSTRVGGTSTATIKSCSSASDISRLSDLQDEEFTEDGEAARCLTFDGSLGAAKNLGDFLDRPIEEEPQHQDGSLAGRQRTQGRDQRVAVVDVRLRLDTGQGVNCPREEPHLRPRPPLLVDERVHEHAVHVRVKVVG